MVCSTLVSYDSHVGSSFEIKRRDNISSNPEAEIFHLLSFVGR